MELNKRQLEILLSLIHQLTDDDSVPELEPEEQELVERMEVQLVIEQRKEATRKGIELYSRMTDRIIGIE